MLLHDTNVRRMERVDIMFNKVKRKPGVMYYSDEKDLTQDTHSKRRQSRIMASRFHEIVKRMSFPKADQYDDLCLSVL